MKTTKTICIILVLIVFQYLNTGCHKTKQNGYITYEGDVYYKSGKPATGVSIKLEACNSDNDTQCNGNRTLIKRKKAGCDGHFYIHERAAKSGVYFVTIDDVQLNANGFSVDSLSKTLYVDVHLTY